MIRRSSSLPLALGLLLAVGLSACTGAGRVQSPTPEAAFERGKALYDRGKYDRAVEYFQHVFDFGRAHEWADDAQYYLADAYFQDGQYLLAANEFTRFVELYRTDERVEEGEYRRALSYVRLSPPYQLDQTDTRTALTYLRLYLAKYPEGTHAAEAGEHLSALRQKLARKQHDIAELYETREFWEAAAISYVRVLEEYPDSDLADDALLGALRSYREYAAKSIPQRQEERYRLADEQYQRLLQLFPNSPLLREAEAEYAAVDAALGRYDEQAASR